eukprot:scaffold29060_cov69-Phaeocystis_antarctica.AAC.1
MCSARAKNSQSPAHAPASSHGEALALGGFSITKETHDTRRTCHANPCTLWLHCGEKPLAVAPAVALDATLKTKGSGSGSQDRLSIRRAGTARAALRLDFASASASKTSAIDDALT